jgi:4,5-dihydroxyphthalate decarboxylase
MALSKLKLNLACMDYDRVRPLMDGRVQAHGIDLNILPMRPRETFPRMLERSEFEASELSLASYTILKSKEDKRFVSIPVALSKLFRHSCIYIRKGSGIKSPADLKGKRVGTTQYGSTAVVFMKGLMQDEYGVRPEDMHWFMGGLEAPVQNPLLPLKLPEKFKLEFLKSGVTLEDMMEKGELDALFSIYLPPSFLRGDKHITRLFPDYKEAEKAYYKKTKIFPIMHTVVLRRDVYEANPWAARNLYAAFLAAKDLAIEGLYDTDALHLTLPFLLDHIEENWRTFGEDFWAYGYDANKATLEAVGRWVHDQGLAPRVVKAQEIFDPAMDGSGDLEPVMRRSAIPKV